MRDADPHLQVLIDDVPDAKHRPPVPSDVSLSRRGYSQSTYPSERGSAPPARVPGAYSWTPWDWPIPL